MNVSVIGAGSWGSAFALHLGRKNMPTKLWIRERDVYENTRRYKENKAFLAGSIFPSSVTFFNQLEEVLDDTEVVFIAVPSKFCREMYQRMAPYLSSKHVIVSLTKGIETETLRRMSELMEDIFFPSFQPKIVSLSGPSFAREVAESHPTAVVAASRDASLSREIQHLVSNDYLRVYSSNDIIGVELAGALKNVIAISAGISDGLEFGSNSVAALITRGLTEITRLGIQLGAKMETFAGLAGIGDLVLTCTGKLSRNRYVGYELGKGKALREIVANMQMVAEGIDTTLSAHELARREGVEMPICDQAFQILYEEKDPRTALQDLMSRKLKDELQ